MMRKIVALFVVSVLLAACEKPGDCIKSAGNMTSKSYDGLEFHTIVVHKGIGLVITQGDEFNVELHGGENLINDINVAATDGVLTLEDQTTCNWVRDYGQTIAYITTPNLTDIYSKTECSISSNGMLTFPQLRIVSMDSHDSYTGTGTGDFYLEINNNMLIVENNSVSRFFISGQTQNLNVSFYESGGIFYGQELRAQQIDVYHRGSNDMYVHPIGSISGDIFNIGNVYSVTRPPIVNVTEHYQGRLFFF